MACFMRSIRRMKRQESSPLHSTFFYSPLLFPDLSLFFFIYMYIKDGSTEECLQAVKRSPCVYLKVASLVLHWCSFTEQNNTVLSKYHFREKNNIRWIGVLSVGRNAFLSNTIDQIALGYYERSKNVRWKEIFLSNDKSRLCRVKNIFFCFLETVYEILL